MPRNGAGIYIPPPSNPVHPGTVIESEWANDTVADISNALSQSISYDGQTVPIANLDMGGFHHLNVSDAVSRNQYATFGQVQDSRHTRLNGVSGVDNIVGTLPGGATSYVAGALISFFAVGANTGPMTLNYNGIGAKSLATANGSPLVGGEVQANDFLLVYYDGTMFRFLSVIRSTLPPEVFQLRTSGQQRPPSGLYPQLTIATASTINIPAGTAWVIPPDSDSSVDAVKVTWLAQTITLTFLNTSFTTTIAVNNVGQIIQFAGRLIGAGLRSSAVLGVVEHITGVANKVVTRPFIFGDDGYRGTDASTLLSNSLISGGLVTGNAVSLLQMDISAGSIFMPGGDANTIDAPNFYPIAQQANIPFRTLAGQNTVGASILNAPVTQYDPNGAGIVTVLPNNGDTVIHKLYYLYGQFIWVYGQIIYTSVENALSFIEVDRTRYKPSLFLQDATLVAEVVAQKSATSLTNLAMAAIVAPGGINFSIGSPGGISEAPQDGTPYGRQNAGWVNVLRALAPAIQNSASITGAAPKLDIVMNPYAAGTAAVNFWANAFKWFAVEVTNPDDKAYFRSYNPVNGALRTTFTYDLATGSIVVPGQVQLPNGSVGAPALSFATNPNTGMYLAAANDLRMSVNGVDVYRNTAGANTLTGATTILGQLTVGGTGSGNIIATSSAASSSLRSIAGAGFTAQLILIGDGGTLFTDNVEIAQSANTKAMAVTNRANAPMLFATNNTNRGAFEANGEMRGMHTNNGVANPNSKMMVLTAAQYAAIGVKDANTLYFVT
jgi:hypothetical protein